MKSLVFVLVFVSLLCVPTLAHCGQFHSQVPAVFVSADCATGVCAVAAPVCGTPTACHARPIRSVVAVTVRPVARAAHVIRDRKLVRTLLKKQPVRKAARAVGHVGGRVLASRRCR